MSTAGLISTANPNRKQNMCMINMQNLRNFCAILANSSRVRSTRLRHSGGSSSSCSQCSRSMSNTRRQYRLAPWATRYSFLTKKTWNSCFFVLFSMQCHCLTCHDQRCKPLQQVWDQSRIASKICLISKIGIVFNSDYSFHWQLRYSFQDGSAYHSQPWYSTREPSRCQLDPCRTSRLSATIQNCPA